MLMYHANRAYMRKTHVCANIPTCEIDDFIQKDLLRLKSIFRVLLSSLILAAYDGVAAPSALI